MGPGRVLAAGSPPDAKVKEDPDAFVALGPARVFANDFYLGSRSRRRALLIHGCVQPRARARSDWLRYLPESRSSRNRAARSAGDSDGTAFGGASCGDRPLPSRTMGENCNDISIRP